MHKAGLSKAQTRILEQYWKLGTCSVREIPDSLPEDERVAYTTVQTLVYRLEQKGALRGVGRGVQHCNGWGVLGTVSHTAGCFADEHVATVTVLPRPVSCRRQIADNGQLKSLP
jgi:hypothetical protein